MYRFNIWQGGCRARISAAATIICAIALIPADLTAAAGVPRGRAVHASTRPDVARFHARVDAILSAAPASRSYWGIVVADRDTGE
ncbi:MAG: hypothetical protein ACRD3S_07415, partial [Terracidiphilus sp.]